MNCKLDSSNFSLCYFFDLTSWHLYLQFAKNFFVQVIPIVLFLGQLIGLRIIMHIDNWLVTLYQIKFDYFGHQARVWEVSVEISFDSLHRDLVDVHINVVQVLICQLKLSGALCQWYLWGALQRRTPHVIHFVFIIWYAVSFCRVPVLLEQGWIKVVCWVKLLIVVLNDVIRHFWFNR